MKKTLTALALALLILSRAAYAQTDPRDQSPVVVFAAQATTATSAPYAVILSAAGETVWFSFSGTGIAGEYTIEGSIDTEANVKAGTAVWTTLLTSAVLPAGPWISDPMPYLRVTIARSAGTFKVLMRGSVGTNFRKVE